jgi:hypothetical protein
MMIREFGSSALPTRRYCIPYPSLTQPVGLGWGEDLSLVRACVRACMRTGRQGTIWRQRWIDGEMK